MLLDSAPIHKAQTGNTGAIQEFNIKASAKAFGILSSGLYSNKIRAIIRELSCNAWDSHVAAGKTDIAFEVHLPNMIEPWFSVKDYGTGLSVQEVQKIYSTYFESTKTDSNDFTGALGLGSKSPFSYTDNFSVESTKNGVCALFSCIINDNGVPSTVLMSTYSTDKPNGIEVKFSVNNSDDFRKFESEAQTALAYFPINPIVQGNACFEFSRFKILEENVLSGVDIIFGKQSYVLMGNVAYALDANIIIKHEPKLACIFSSQSLLIKMDIGAVDIQASREGLSYIPSTVKALCDKIRELHVALENKINAEYSTCVTVYEKLKFLQDKKNTGIAFSRNWAFNIQKNTPELSEFFDAYDTYSGLYISTKELREEFNIECTEYYISTTGKVVESSPIYKDYYSGNYIRELSYRFDFTKTLPVVFLMNAPKTDRSTKRLLGFNKTEGRLPEGVRSFYVFRAFDSSKEIKFKEFYARVYNPTSVLEVDALSLSPVPKQTRVPKEKKPCSILKYDSYLQGFKLHGKSSDIPDSQKCYYMIVSNMTPTSDENIYPHASTLFSDLERADLIKKDFCLYAVRQSEKDIVKLKHNWIHIDEYVKEKLKGITKTDVASKAFSNSNLNTSLCYKFNPTFINSIKGTELYNLLTPTRYLKSTVSAYNYLQGIKTLTSKYKVQHNIEYIYMSRFEKFNSLYSSIIKKYPLLKYLYKKEESKDFSDYVLALENSSIDNTRKE